LWRRVARCPDGEDRGPRVDSSLYTDESGVPRPSSSGALVTS
jgi:hypothetical protein